MLSILIDPRPERRDELMCALVQHGINLKYLTITSDEAYTVLKGLVANSQDALSVLQKEGYTAFLKDVLAVGDVEGYPALLSTLQVLEQNGHVAEQCNWVFSPKAGRFLLLLVKDMPAAETVLREAGFNLLHEDML